MDPGYIAALAISGLAILLIVMVIAIAVWTRKK
jgi:hypothetical protein